MGIGGLLPQVKSSTRAIDVKDLRGGIVAVDTYSWLHKGALSCSRHLCKSIPTSRHIDYCMHRVNLLRHHGVKPLLVFDGGFLPMKAEQEAKRSRVRKENMERASEHESAGNTAAAYECYQKAVDITPSIAFELIRVLRKENVDYIVAPYEADAQMAFLSINNLVDAVITEDSDLIPFGCSRIIFKMDKFGQGVEFQSSRLPQNKELNFFGFTKQMLLETCILSGCDYLQSLPGMGLKRAHALIQKFKSYDKVIKHLRYSGVSVPPLYEESFQRAMWTFLYQRVYDPRSQNIVHLVEIPDGLVMDSDFLGPWLSQELVHGIANGDLDPITKMPFQSQVSDIVASDKAYSCKETEQTREKKRIHLPLQKNILTNYFCLASIEAKRKFKAPQNKCVPLAVADKNSPDTEENTSNACIPEDMPCADEKAHLSCVESGHLSNGNLVENESGNAENQCEDASRLGNVNDLGHPCSPLASKGDLYMPYLGSHKECESDLPMDATSKERFKKRRIKLKAFGLQKKLPQISDFNYNGDSNALKNGHPKGEFCANTSGTSSTITKDVHIMTEKRKTPDNHHKENTERVSKSPKHGHPDVLQKGGNLHCDISHLNRYSNIAEASMKKFVSVISAFKYTSNGSRASGLRAPFRDVQNVSLNR